MCYCSSILSVYVYICIYSYTHIITSKADPHETVIRLWLCRHKKTIFCQFWEILMNIFAFLSFSECALFRDKNAIWFWHTEYLKYLAVLILLGCVELKIQSEKCKIMDIKSEAFCMRRIQHYNFFKRSLMEHLFYFPQNALKFSNTVKLKNLQISKFKILTYNVSVSHKTIWGPLVLPGIFTFCCYSFLVSKLFSPWLLLSSRSVLLDVWLHLVSFRVKDGGSCNCCSKVSRVFSTWGRSIIYLKIYVHNIQISFCMQYIFQNLQTFCILIVLMDNFNKPYPKCGIWRCQISPSRNCQIEKAQGRSKCLSARSYLMTS